MMVFKEILSYAKAYNTMNESLKWLKLGLMGLKRGPNRLKMNITWVKVAFEDLFGPLLYD